LIPVELLGRAKIEAKRRDCSLEELVQAAIDEYVAEHRSLDQAKAVLAQPGAAPRKDPTWEP
jgi:hypothetical protein